MINQSNSELNRIAAVVVTYGRPDELRLVVAALLSQTISPERVLVIDNASTLPAQEVLADFTGIDVFRSEVNTGGAGGFALALEHALKAKCEWVWMMDDDAVPRPEALERLVNAAQRLPQRAGVLCSAVFEFDQLALMHRRRYGHWFGLESLIPQSNYQQSLCEIDTGSFVGFMVRAEAVESVGLPDSDFFLAYDDTEYSLRLKAAGWSLWLVPDSEIDHLRGVGSRLRGSAFGAKHFYNIRNRIFVTRRYSLLGVFSATVVGVLILLAAKSPFRRESIQLFWRALVDGYRGRLGKVDL